MSTSIPGRMFGIALIVAAAAALGAYTESQQHRSHQPAPLMSDDDVTFAQMMMTHHQQALTICDLLTPQAAPEVRTLAEQIKLQQQAEIGTMIGWLQIADQPLNPPATPTPPGHGMSGMSHPDGPSGHTDTQMGMASPEELAHLRHAGGRDNEALFLQLMTRHHQGGAQMAYDESRNGSNEAVRRTALAMVTEQTQEIQLMEQLMKPRNTAPLPAP